MLILASASPRRREILTQAGYTFSVQPTNISEEQHPGENPITFALRLAREKATATDSAADDYVLGADTVVIAPDQTTLGKPTDAEDAARMLRLLSGATHQVVTGVCLHSSTRTECAAELTWVTMHTISEPEIAAYVSSGEPFDKAGAYAIQGRAARWIPRIHGCYFNVVGLPIALVSSMLSGMSFHQPKHP